MVSAHRVTGFTGVLAWAGIALLVGTGLYVLHDERSRARAELEPIADQEFVIPAKAGIQGFHLQCGSPGSPPALG